MKSIMKNKTIGFYLLILALVFSVASLVYYVGWSQANYSMNNTILIGLIAGIAVNALLLFYENDFLVIVLTALYSIALFQLLVDSAGSFADAYQGIVMFGDPTQVGTIITISALIAVGVVSTVISSFLKRETEEKA